MKNNICLVFVLILLVACNNGDANKLGQKVVLDDEPISKTPEKLHPIVSKWKIYKINLGGKDISKSSDPNNENGIEFTANNSYISFGNPGHQDNGTYTLQNEDQNIQLSSQKGNNTTLAAIDLKGDSLSMKFTLPNEKLLLMELYRMSN